MFYAAQKPADLKNASLYWRLGGSDALNAAVDEVIKVSKADPRLAGRLSGACAPKLKEQLCAATGGPCTYTGRDMKTAHAGMGVERSNFNALVEDLQIAMNKRGIPFRAQNKLLAKLAPMHRDIEGAPAK
jgi:hemoglobin